MPKPECNICNGPEIYGVMPTVVESDLWRVELNPNQQHLGRTFVGLREHKSSLGDLSVDDMLEFRRIVVALEVGARAAFNPDLFNWMCLMNDSARDGQEPHIHWHMVPRYRQPVAFSGRVFTDDSWPRQYNTGKDKPYRANPDEIIAITNAMRAGISKNL